ncbi:MAG: HEAT repeat domain-containing protein [Proteobacteria bacterium]|nr:HEAT repeat domain-containing protein [Pseudomonadota bacterium]
MITDIIKKLKPLLTDSRKNIAEKTAKAIARLQAKQYFDNAYSKYEDLNEQNKTRLLMEINNVCPKAGFDFINKALDDELPQVKAIAIKTAIEQNDPRFIQKIAQLINDFEPIVRKLAYEFLGKFPLPQITTVLNKKLLIEEDKEALHALIIAIGNIGNPDSYEFLQKLLDQVEDPFLKEVIVESIGKLKL